MGERSSCTGRRCSSGRPAPGSRSSIWISRAARELGSRAWPWRWSSALRLDGLARVAALARRGRAPGARVGLAAPGRARARACCPRTRRVRNGGARDDRAGAHDAVGDARARGRRGPSGTCRSASASCSCSRSAVRRRTGAILRPSVASRRAAARGRRLRRAGVARASGHPRRPRRVELARARSSRRARRARRPASRPGRAARSRAERTACAAALVLGVVLGEDEGLARRRPGRLPRVRPLPPAGRLRAERRLHRGRDLRARLAAAAVACRRELVDPRRDRGVRPRRRLAAVRRPRRSRRRARVARLARRATDRPLALPRASARSSSSPGRPTSLLEPGFQLSFAAVAAIFVAVPRLRRRLDGLSGPGAARRRARRRARVRGRDGADRPPPLRRGAGLHGARERRGVRRGAARPRARTARGCRRSRLARGSGRARLARGLGGGVARARRARRRRLPSAQVGDAAGARRRRRARRRVGRPASAAASDLRRPSRARSRLRVGGAVLVAGAAWAHPGRARPRAAGRAAGHVPRRRPGRRGPARDAARARARRPGPARGRTRRSSSAAWASARSRRSS